MEKLMGKSLETTTQKLMEILKSRFAENCEGKEVTETTLFEKDLRIDSLDRYELCYFIEGELDVHIPDEKIWDLENVRDYANYIESHKK